VDAQLSLVHFVVLAPKVVLWIDVSKPEWLFKKGSVLR
jgi:hypothetical protein